MLSVVYMLMGHMVYCNYIINQHIHITNHYENGYVRPDDCTFCENISFSVIRKQCNAISLDNVFTQNRNLLACISKTLMVSCVIRIMLCIVYFDFCAERIYLQ